MFAIYHSFLRHVGRFATRSSITRVRIKSSTYGSTFNASIFGVAGGLLLTTFIGYKTFETLNADSNERNSVLEKNSIKSNLRIFSGESNRPLAEAIVKDLGTQLGLSRYRNYPDGGVSIDIGEDVHGKDIYFVQSICSPNINDNLMELMFFISAARRAGSRRVTAVIPYFGYARQNRRVFHILFLHNKMVGRVPVYAADVARLLEAMGVNRVVAVDLHYGQIQGYFGPAVPVDDLHGGVVGVDYFAKIALHKPIIVSPDASGVYRVKKFRDGMMMKYGIDTGLAMIIKQRGKPGQIEAMDLVGSVDDCDCIIVDDMIDTAGTLCKAAGKLKENGARRVYAFASHGLFSMNASECIKESALEQVVILNTVPLSVESSSNEKIVQLSVAHLLADAIRAVHGKLSVSELFY